MGSRSTTRWGAVGFAALGTGFVTLVVSLRRFDIRTVVAGTVATTIGIVLVVGWIGDLLSGRTPSRRGDPPPTPADRRPLHLRASWLFGALGLVASTSLVVLGERRAAPEIVLVGVVAAVFSLAPLSYFSSRLVAHHPRGAITVGAAATTAGPVLVVAAGASVVTGAVLFVFGLAASQLGLATWLDRDAPAGLWGPTGLTAVATATLVVGALLVVVGIVSTGGAAPVDAPTVGAFFVVVAMVTLSVTLPALPEPPDLRVAGPIGALLVLFGGAVLLRSGLATGDVGIGFTVAIVLALVGAFIVWRGEAIFLVVLLGVAVVWASIDRTVDLDPDPDPRADRVLVALGDSYISGEGAPEFFAGTDQKSPQNECRRAPTAYPRLVAEASAHDLGLLFLACSGARMRNVTSFRDVTAEGQYGEDPQLDRLVAEAERWKGLPSGERREPAAVVLSIGGNDARFGDVGKGCILPGSCTEQREIWLQNVEALGVDLEVTYRSVRETLAESGADVPVLVMPYPLVLTDDGCTTSPLRRDEHEFLVEFITVLNDQIRASASRAGVHFVEEAMFAFEGERICEGDSAAMNLVGLQATDGDLLQQLDPANWVHNSMHPTPDGHRRTAAVLVDVVDDLLTRIDTPGSTEPANPPERSEVAQVLGIRTVAPTLVDPADDLVRGLLATYDGSAPDPATFTFATRTVVFDEDTDLDTDDLERVRIPLPLADPDAPVRFTDGAGDWNVAVPVPDDDEDEGDGNVGGDGDGKSGGDGDPAPTVTLIDGLVTIELTAPEQGSDRWVVVDDGAGDVQLRAYRFCSADPDCPNDFGAWQADQLARAVRTAAPTVVLLVVGGWLFALRFRLDLWVRRLRGGGSTELGWHHMPLD